MRKQSHLGLTELLAYFLELDLRDLFSMDLTTMPLLKMIFQPCIALEVHCVLWLPTYKGPAECAFGVANIQKPMS